LILTGLQHLFKNSGFYFGNKHNTVSFFCAHFLITQKQHRKISIY
jgi:hypothetical protein